MITYIIRRLLLMPITLFGITVMVFLIVRFAPGSPAKMSQEDTMDAETREAERKRIEEKYGLNLPYHMQYLRWWRNMFTMPMQARSWYDDGSATLRPVYTLRKAPSDLYLRMDDGSWYVVTEPEFASDFWEGDHPDFLKAVVLPVLDEGQLPEVSPEFESGPVAELGIDFAKPVHVFAQGGLMPTASLDDDVHEQRLLPATAMDFASLPAQAMAWSNQGEMLYVNPNDPLRPIGQTESGAWFILTPDVPIGQSRVYPISDKSTLKPILGKEYRKIPEEDLYRRQYATPKVAVLYGKREVLDNPPTGAESLTRLAVPTIVKAPAVQWFQLPDSDRYAMLWEPEENLSPALVRLDDGSWKQIISASRVAPFEYDMLKQDDGRLLTRLSDDDRAALPKIEDQPRVPRHVILAGKLAEYERRPEPREIRRYSHPVSIFEVTLGRSEQNKATVVEEMKRRLPITLLLNLSAFPLIYMIAIPTGMVMAVKRGRYFDRGSNVVMLALWSVPTVLSATLLIGYAAVGGLGVEWFPNNGLSSVGAESMPFFGYLNENEVWVRGWVEDRLWHLVLPVFCVVYGGFAYLAKQMRAAMLDNFTMDYVRTARAKGVAFKDIIFQHVLRNSLLPLITIFATILPALIAGSVIIEKIFNIEGMGLLAFRAVQSRDFDVIQSLALIAGTLNLSGLLVADICYALADPRITHR